jgi:hypothetical protein
MSYISNRIRASSILETSGITTSADVGAIITSSNAASVTLPQTNTLTTILTTDLPIGCWSVQVQMFYSGDIDTNITNMRIAVEDEQNNIVLGDIILLNQMIPNDAERPYSITFTYSALETTLNTLSFQILAQCTGTAISIAAGGFQVKLVKIV